MKIALVATHYAEYAANLALALSRSHEVLLILGARNASWELVTESFAKLRMQVSLRIVPHHYAPLQPFVAARCAHLVKDFAPDIVHVQEHPTRSMYWLARNLRSQWPLVTTVHDPTPHSGADASAADVFAKYHHGLRDLSDRIVVHGEALISTIAQTLNDGPARVRPVPHGVLRFGVLVPDLQSRSEPARALVLFGRLNRYKGLDVLLDANDIWLARRAALRVIVAGMGPELARLRARLGAAPNFELMTGRVSQPTLAALVRANAASILPYHDATQSGAAASSLGVGTPVIATRVGAIPEMIVNDENGVLVPPGDAQALADAGQRILDDNRLRETLALGAQRSAEGRLSWQAIATMTEAVYSDARN